MLVDFPLAVAETRPTGYDERKQGQNESEWELFLAWTAFFAYLDALSVLVPTGRGSEEFFPRFRALHVASCLIVPTFSRYLQLVLGCCGGALLPQHFHFDECDSDREAIL